MHKNNYYPVILPARHNKTVMSQSYPGLLMHQRQFTNRFFFLVITALLYYQGKMNAYITEVRREESGAGTPLNRLDRHTWTYTL